MVQVKWKWAFITGAARGIGYLTAKFMAEQDCNLILHSRKKEHCEKVLGEVKAMGVEAYSVEAELSDLDSVQAMLDEIDRMGVTVDIVLNAPESAIPGIVVGAFVDDKKSGRYLNAPYFTGLTLEEAVAKAERKFDSPYDKK